MTATVAKISDAGAAFAYYSERDDYYLSDKSSAEWYGDGAGRLGLSNDLNPRDFRDVLTGQFRSAQVGTPARHTPGWDMTFSSPKSVSIAALVRKDERVTKAHDAAVRVALAHLEQHSIVTRQRAGDGSYEWHATGNMVAGVVRHSTSRNLDPQLHSHCVVANMTRDARTGKWVSIDSRAGLYTAQREVGNIYMAELAAGIREAGYEIDWQVDSRGNATFELVEISQIERDVFSSRRAEIEAQLVARGIDPDSASGKARQAATLDTRSAKEHVPGKDLHARWAQQARALGLVDTVRPDRKNKPTTAAKMDAARVAVTAGIASLSERQTRFTSRQIVQVATTFSQGRASQSDLAEAVRDARASGVLIDRGVQIRGYGKSLERTNGYTTRSAMEAEQDMLRRAGKIEAKEPALSLSGHDVDRLIEQRVRVTGFEFSAEQRQATVGILASGSGLAVVQGYAGTAKTTSVLATVADAAQVQNIRVRAIAPTHSAAETLGHAIGAESQTVAALNSRPLERDGRKEIWIVDEAGMVSAGDMRALLTRANQSGAQVVLVGDAKQIGSVGAGSAFQQLQDANADRTYRLTDIKRQTSAELRAAVYDALEGKFRDALGKVETREIAARNEAAKEIADSYVQQTIAGKRTLVVTLSRDDRADVNRAIQQLREATGEVKNTRAVATLSPKQWTEIERRDASRYRAGDVIEALRDFKNGPGRGELATIENVKEGWITARMAGGETWRFNPTRTTKYHVLDKSDIGIGEGDRVVAKGSMVARDATEQGKQVRVKNGAAMTVSEIGSDGHMTVMLDDGRQVIIDAAQGAKVDLDYAQTANQAQGTTVDSVIAYMRSSQTNLADRQRAYVAMSRAKESALVVTDDKAKLAETLERSSHGKETAKEAVHLGKSQQQAAVAEQRPMSARAKEWAADTLAAIENSREDRRARERAKQSARYEKRDREWLRTGVKAQRKIERRSAKSEREIASRYGTRINAGKLGRMLENKQQRTGRAIIERVRQNRDQAMRNVSTSLDRAFERSVDREARQQRISAAEARKRVIERTLIDREFRFERASIRAGQIAGKVASSLAAKLDAAINQRRQERAAELHLAAAPAEGKVHPGNASTDGERDRDVADSALLPDRTHRASEPELDL